MRNAYIHWIVGLMGLCLGACSSGPVTIDKESDSLPEIIPDYKEVTIPVNIAPLNFGLSEKTEPIKQAIARFTSSDYTFQVEMKKGTFPIPESDWKTLVEKSAGGAFEVQVIAREKDEWIGYRPFTIYVSPDSIDAYLAYRRIEPGYELWKELGIYQRDLSTYDETPILENMQTGGNCMNCHSFCNRRADRFLFHMRQKFGGTYIVEGDRVEKLTTKTPETLSDLVYPSWHPEGRFVAFSVNKTQQLFHDNDRNRIEVYDMLSDVVVYDTETHEIITSPLLFRKEAFETFPSFSPDGKTLYFCTAEAQKMPEDFKEVKYSLCAVSFDSEKRTFGLEVDTLYSAPKQGKSVSFPRVSPDGHYLMYTLSDYGNFSIWHKEADLYLIDLRTGKHRRLKEVNSRDVESYHSWSSNGRWFVFSSRRNNGLYTRPYFAHISEDGTIAKPFLMPQKDKDYYLNMMQSYNIPEFISSRVDIKPRSFVNVAKEPGIPITFKK